MNTFARTNTGASIAAAVLCGACGAEPAGDDGTAEQAATAATSGAWGRTQNVVLCGADAAARRSPFIPGARVKLGLGSDCAAIGLELAIASTTVEVKDDWTLAIDSYEPAGIMRSIQLSSLDSDGQRYRDFVVDWVPVEDDVNRSYLVGLRNLITGSVSYRSMSWHGLTVAQPLRINIGKSRIDAVYAGRTESFDMGFVGVGSSKTASVHSWNAPRSMRSYNECAPGRCSDPFENVSARMLPVLTSTSNGPAVNSPAYAVAALNATGLTALGVQGVRQTGFSTPAGLHDTWRIGSNSKSFTGLLAFRLDYLKPGFLNKTILEAFGDTRIPSYFHKLTLENVLAHRAGLHRAEGLVIDGKPWDKYLDELDRTMTPAAARQKAVIDALLSATPFGCGSRGTCSEINPDGTFVERYSNFGILVASAMIEKFAKKSFEQLLAEHILDPFRMTSCGIGPNTPAPGSSAPRGVHGHGGAFDTGYHAVWWEGWEFNAGVGEIYCSLADWSKLLREHLRGRQGYSTYVPLRSAWEDWHNKGQYHLGLGVWDYPWSKGIAKVHNGGVGGFSTYQYIIPGQGTAYLGVTNTGDGAVLGPLETSLAQLFWDRLP